MSSFKTNLHSLAQVATSWLVCVSLALAPFAGMQSAQALEGVNESIELTEAANLMIDLTLLLDRAYYPGVPRKETGLQPIANELAKAEARMIALKAEFDRNFSNRIALTYGSEAETDLFVNVVAYFNVAQKLEELKFLTGQNRFDTSLYTLKLDTTEFSQAEFLAHMSYMGTGFADLSVLGVAYSSAATEARKNFNFSTRLENSGGKWLLVCELLPDFINGTEITAMVSNPNNRNVLRFALHFVASQLYDSQAVAHQLLRQSMGSMPEPSQALRDEFISLRFKKAQFERIEASRLSGAEKPAVQDKVLNAVDQARKTGTGYIIDADFMDTYYRLSEIPTTAEENKIESENMRAIEQESFEFAFGALLNLVDLKQDIPGQVEFIIKQALLLTVRHLFVADFEVSKNLSAPGALDQFKAYLDQKAAAVAAQITLQGRLGQEIQNDLGQISLTKVLTKNRVDFQARLNEEAAKINSFIKDSISINYLLSSKQNELLEMQLSEFVGGILVPVKQGEYEQGYSAYMKFLLTYLEGFKAPGKMPARFGDIAAIRDQLQWNNDALKGRIEERLVQVVNADAQARKKDLLDLIHIGEMLKFDAYEKLAPGTKPTAANLELADPGTTDLPLIGFLFQSEKKNYVKAIKNDLINSAPLLGANVDADGYKGELWEALNERAGSPEALYALVDKKLGQTLEQTMENFTTLDRQLEKFHREGGDTLASAGDELKTLMSRASQITVGFKQFTGFGAYYEDMRQEIVTPEYVMRQWAHLSDYSEKAFLFIMGYFVLQVAATRLGVAKGVAKFTAGLLTPIFGPSLRGLNWALTAFLGLSIGKDLFDGFIVEAGHYNTLEKFWACGSEKPCVSLYSDLSQQEAIMNMPRTKAITTIAMLAGFMLVFGGFGKIWGYFMKRGQTAAGEILIKHQKALGLKEGSSLAEMDLKAAVEARYNSALKNYPAHPNYAEIVRLYAREAQASLESMVWKSAKEWAAAEKRFAPALRNLGLKPQDLKDLDLLIKRRNSLFNERQLGNISSAAYNRHLYALNQMTEFVSPFVKQMKDSPSYFKFMERVWFSAGHTPMDKIFASRIFYADRYIKDYAEFSNRIMLKPKAVGGRIRLVPVPSILGRRSVDRFLSQLEKSLKRDPRLSEVNPSDIRSWMLKASGQ